MSPIQKQVIGVFFQWHNQKQNVVLLLERLLAPENETLLRKQVKQLLEGENLKLHQEKVLEERLKEDLQEDEDDRIFSFFIHI